jgi:hypothetical protein
MYHPRMHAWIVIAFAVLLGSCNKKAPSPPVPARVVLPKTEPAKELPKPLPPAPRIATVPPEDPPVLVEVNPPPAPKPQPPPAQKKGRASRRKAPEVKPVEAAQAKPVEVIAEPPTGPTTPAPAPTGPRLAPMLTPDQTKEYTRKFEGALDRAKTAVTLIQGKALNTEQKETVTTIKSFVAQAEQAREQDLVSAVSLAERADLLSRDLLDRLR